MAIPPPPKRRDRPALLTKAEALTFAAEQLEETAMNCELSKMIVDAIGSKPIDDPEVATKVAELKRVMVEPDLQIAAMRSAAAAIRELAIEERVVGARAAAAGISTRSGGGVTCG